jgi:hypothetical protein
VMQAEYRAGLAEQSSAVQLPTQPGIDTHRAQADGHNLM